MCKSIQIEDGKALKIIHQANLNKYYSHNSYLTDIIVKESSITNTHVQFYQIDEIN